jgi:transcriptional regulator with XRE-family HTH domain
MPKPLVIHARSDWSRLRVEAGSSLRRLEVATGISRATLSHIDRGLPPTVEQSIRLLRVLRPEHPGGHPFDNTGSDRIDAELQTDG